MGEKERKDDPRKGSKKGRGHSVRKNEKTRKKLTYRTKKSHSRQP